MTRKTKVTLSLDEKLDQQLADIGRRRKVPKSRLVEEAIRLWQKKLLQEELREGYRAMAGEDGRTAEEFLPATAEDLE